MEPVNLHPIGEEIWEQIQMIKFFGIPLPHRMTIIRLGNGDLVVHSPTRCDEGTIDAMNRLGKVAHVIAPNGMHDLFLQDYAVAFPEAQVWIPAGVEKYFKAVPGALSLPMDCEKAPWQDELSYAALGGMPRLNECLFFHRRSKSMICADLFFNINHQWPRMTRMVARLGGFYGRLAVPHDIRLFIIRDKKAFRESVRKVESWGVQNVIIGHGDNVMGDGEQQFRKGTAWLGG